MGCNCQTDIQIMALNEEYGEGAYIPHKSLGKRIRRTIDNIILGIEWIIDTPLIIGYVIYKSMCKDKNISITKHFKMRKQ